MSGQPVVNTTQTQQAPKPSQQISGGVDSKQASHTRGSGLQTSRPQHGGKRNRNRHSRGGKGKPTGKFSKKQGKPQRKPAPVRRGPVNDYISSCCKVRAIKPRCGLKVQEKDPETGKMKETRKGLGHFRCPECRKYCKVVPQKPQPKEEINANTTVEITVGAAA